jgi:hypothetical protein
VHWYYAVLISAFRFWSTYRQQLLRTGKLVRSHKSYVVGVLNVFDLRLKPSVRVLVNMVLERERRAGSNYRPRRCALSNSTVMTTPAITIMTGTSVGCQTL